MKKGFTLLEILITSVILAIMTISTVSFMSSFVTAEVNFNNDINNKQDKINLYERLSDDLKQAAYIYKDNVVLTIPTQSSTRTITNTVNAIAVLVPKFNSDGTLVMLTPTTTKFSGIAFSIIPESAWNGGNSSKYVLIQTIFDDNSLNIAADSNDSLVIIASPPTNWGTGKSYLIADNLKPARFTQMGQDAFYPSDKRDSIEFGFIPKDGAIYYPSPSGTKTLNDDQFVTNIVLRNWRETSY